MKIIGKKSKHKIIYLCNSFFVEGEKNENWKKYRVWRRNVEEENYKKYKLIKENKW